VKIIKQTTSDLKIGDKVYLYEIREKDNGDIILLSSEVLIQFEAKFGKARGYILNSKGPEPYLVSVGGYNGTPHNNKVWLETKDDKKAYEALISYYSSRAKEAKKTYERLKKRKEFLEGLVKEL
jgi:hypothetical protein